MDAAVSFLGLLLISPVLLIISLIIKLESRGSACFRQERMGKHGELFKMVKFRTMVMDEEEEARQFTPGCNQRVTSIGAFLRRTKIDELPALINVIRGDMSIVGPRPEVPKYKDIYQKENKELLNIRPGITGFASIKYRDEEGMLANRESPEKFYEEEILPDKLRLGLDYVNSVSFCGDVRIILCTFRALFSRKPFDKPLKGL